MTRGLLVPLTLEQSAVRLEYLAGLVTADKLDEFVRGREAGARCPTMYYRLEDHNGGTDPTASDPASRWTNDDGKTTFVTCDCSGAQAWAHGYDRYQPVRAKHRSGGWINTDFMVADAMSKNPRCFRRVLRPERGAIIVHGKGFRGRKVGHTGGVIGYKLAEWDPRDPECWEAIRVVDVAGRKGRANLETTGGGWFDKKTKTGGIFVVPIMTP